MFYSKIKMHVLTNEYDNMEEFCYDINSAKILVINKNIKGLDFPRVDLVIHFEVTCFNNKYIHQSGRTGRAHQNGISIILSGPMYLLNSFILYLK